MENEKGNIIVMKIYKFVLDCYREGWVVGIFDADERDIEANIGKHIYFGSILGKYSEVYCDLSWDNLETLTDDQGFITNAQYYKLIPVGYNPLDYIEEDDEDEEE